MLALQGLLLIVVLLWSVRELRAFSERIKKRRFMEREFDEQEAFIVLARPQRTHLDPPPIPENTLIGKIYYDLLPNIAVLLPFAYPLQKLIVNHGGGVGSLILFLSILAGPMAIHFWGRFCCGAYLYAYKVLQLERQFGKPVVFEAP